MLALENVRKSYVEPTGEPLPILDVPHLAIAAGEQVVLRGRSGCGKTTLLNCIAGLTKVDSGSIKIHGHEVTRLSEAVRDRFRARHIGFVFQTFNLLPGFSALENVMLGMTFTGMPSDANRARQLLADVGLSHRLTHKPRASASASSSAWQSPGRWPTAPCCCWRTNPRPTSTRRISSK